MKCIRDFNLLKINWEPWETESLNANDTENKSLEAITDAFSTNMYEPLQNYVQQAINIRPNPHKRVWNRVIIGDLQSSQKK